MEKSFDIVVLGGGPGGYVAAIRASQLGFKTAVIEKENLGGVCLNWGCIPTKALLKSAEMYDNMKNHASDFGLKFESLEFDFTKIIRRSRNVSKKVSKGVEYLMRKNKIEHIKGFGKLKDNKTIEVYNDQELVETIKAGKIILATGARPKTITSIPVDRERIITSREAMVLKEKPGRIVIIGAGAIGVEFSYFFNVLGSQVTLIEMMDQIIPVEDKESADLLEKSFKKRKIDIKTSTKVEKAERNGDEVIVTISTGDKTEQITADYVLNAIGVEGNVSGFGLEELGVDIDRGFIKVNREDYSTNIPDIYAIGDVNGPPWLAHVASAEGITCVEKIKGLDVPAVDYDSIPGCTYCQPQIASIGMTEKKALEKGYKLKIGRFPYSASGKASAIGEREGFVKLIFDEEYGELLGAHIVGAEATELIAELGIAKSLEADYETIIKTVHAHPTLSEMVMEAAANAYDESIHI